MECSKVYVSSTYESFDSISLPPYQVDYDRDMDATRLKRAIYAKDNVIYKARYGAGYSAQPNKITRSILLGSSRIKQITHLYSLKACSERT